MAFHMRMNKCLRIETHIRSMSSETGDSAIRTRGGSTRFQTQTLTPLGCRDPRLKLDDTSVNDNDNDNDTMTRSE